jgi:hypothetical protein
MTQFDIGNQVNGLRGLINGLWADLAVQSFTADVSVTATSEGTATTVVSVGFPAGTPQLLSYLEIEAEFFSPCVVAPSPSSRIYLVLFADSTVLGQIALVRGNGGTTAPEVPVTGKFRGLTVDTEGALDPDGPDVIPSASNLIVKAWVDSGTGTVRAGTGGSGTLAAGYITVRGRGKL